MFAENILILTARYKYPQSSFKLKADQQRKGNDDLSRDGAMLKNNAGIIYIYLDFSYLLKQRLCWGIDLMPSMRIRHNMAETV